jgi:beta-lactamase regulating signal transducer with metallopeptidase domain
MSIIDSLLVLGGRGAAVLLIWSWQALVLLAVVCLGLKVCRVKSPQLRHQIWLFSLIAIALLPAGARLSQALPEVHPPSSTFTRVAGTPRMVVDLVSQQRVSGSVPTDEVVKNSARAISPASFTWPLLFAIWLIGSALVLTRVLREQIVLSRARRRATPLAGSDFDALGLNPLLSERSALRLSPDVCCPLVYGLFHPTILLPADIAEWTTPPERSSMIAHELVHIERRDPLANLFQTAFRITFFFHPLVRYACRQLSLERELACDDRVVELGNCARSYAEGLLKAAERSLILRTAHQLAFFSPKQILQRRIEMILNRERLRAGARSWKFMIVSGALIAVVAWFLIPAGPGRAQPASISESSFRRVSRLGAEKAFGELLELALRDPDPELQHLAAVQLTELEGDGSTQAMIELYTQTEDAEVKTMLIDTFARISELEPLMMIARSEQSLEHRLLALRRIKALKENSESKDVRNFDVSGLGDQLDQVSPQPPPPPPPPAPFEMMVQDGKPAPLRWHKSGESLFALLRDLAAAAVRNDRLPFEEALDDDYIGTMPNGETRTKSEEIDQIMKRSRQVIKVEFEDVSVSQKEDGAGIANFVAIVHTRVNGEDSLSRQRYSLSFKKVGASIKITGLTRD